MIRTRKDGSIAAYIQDMDQHIRWYGNQMCAIMKNTKKVMTRNIELEEELKATRDGYEEEIVVLLEKNEDLKRKLGIPEVKQEREVHIHEDDYIILVDTDTYSDEDKDSDEDEDCDDDARDHDYEPMESFTDQNF